MVQAKGGPLPLGFYRMTAGASRWFEVRFFVATSECVVFCGDFEAALDVRGMVMSMGHSADIVACDRVIWGG